MATLLIKNGTIVTATDEYKGDVFVLIGRGDDGAVLD